MPVVPTTPIMTIRPSMTVVIASPLGTTTARCRSAWGWRWLTESRPAVGATKASGGNAPGQCLVDTGQSVQRQRGVTRVPTDKPFVPFSVRRGARSPEDLSVLHPGIPIHLRPSLLGWVSSVISDYGFEGYLQRRLQVNPRDWGSQTVFEAASKDDDLMLDVVDAILQRFPVLYESSDYIVQNYVQGLVTALDGMLTESSSAYAVDLSDGAHLTQRVDRTAEQAFDNAVELAGQASELLKKAWVATFKRDPDPSSAYRDAVFAVESVACQMFIPADHRPTLGKAISHLQNTLSTWTVATLDDQQQASAETLLAMLRTVWQNHERHVGQGGAAPDLANQQEAEAVLFLAVTIVQWFERGLVRKR